VATVIALVSYFRKGESDTKTNSEAIERLERAINALVDKIDKLIEDRSDTKATLASHEARITNLERK
jgi:hypothetical protein